MDWNVLYSLSSLVGVLVGASLLQYHVFFFSHRETSTFVKFEWNIELKLNLLKWPGLLAQW